ncbi:MAG: alkaline phosphatase [Planctomycetales bacterium]|nr:alkaline phosphatase [Planctomycetales bacterium]
MSKFFARRCTILVLVACCWGLTLPNVVRSDEGAPSHAIMRPDGTIVTERYLTAPDGSVVPETLEAPPAITLGPTASASPTTASAGDSAAGVKNVILMIGDGMGPQQVGLLALYARHAPSSTVPDRTAALEQLINEGGVGVVFNEPHGALVVDSAAAATQLATGQYAGSEMIGLNYQGDPAETVVEVAKALGKSAGLVSDTRATHATPAAFAAHQPHRSMENEIAVDMLEDHVDVLLSGGLRHWVPEAINNRQSTAYAALLQMTGGVFPATSKRNDNRNLLLEARGEYALVFDRFALDRVKQGPVLGLFADSEMHDALLERAELDSEGRTQPTLVEMTEKALEVLSQNPNGFFLMVEGGQIDWAGHNNDAGTLLHELLRFDAAVRAVHDWARRRRDTVVLVTADHETGSFGLSYSGRPLPSPIRLPGAEFGDARPFEPNFNFGDGASLDRIFGQQKSFNTIMLEFDALPAKDQSAERLMDMVNDGSPVKITLEDAVEVLTRAPNRNYAKGHPYLGTKTVPAVRDFEAFYVYGENLRMNVLGRKVAAGQNVVWGTGTHTSTPVLVASYGPEAAIRSFTGVMHQTDLGQRMMELVRAGATAGPVDAARR